MKKLKHIVLLTLVIIIASLFAGCVEETTTFEINKNGGTALSERLITKEVYDQLIEMGSNLDGLKEDGYTVDFINKDGVEYLRATKKFELKNSKELERYFQELCTSTEGADSEKYFKSFSVKSKEEKITLSGEIGSPDAAATYTSCKIILKFDDEIQEFTIGKKINNKTLEIDMLKLWEEKAGKSFTIVAECSGGNVLPYILIGIAVLTAGAVIVFVIFIKKRKNNCN